jgi:2-oxoisovalerate dehydrogenase E1 component alpha subunit
VVVAAKSSTELLPGREPVRLIDQRGRLTRRRGGEYALPAPDALLSAYRALVLGRRFDQQATSLVKQGRLAVYPSSHGQEASEVGAVRALARTDWIFPTYRDSVALVTRGIDPVEVLTLLRGDWHVGYDPMVHRTAPQCTPLATQALHAVGVAYAAKAKDEDTAVLAFLGDGATSEGDFHEALNFAAVFQAPVVFFVQNNQYAISVPLARQSVAPSLAHKGVGYGIPGVRVDGNDVAAVLSVVTHAAERARSGGGPTLVEAHTYRMEPHTNADDATRYRTDEEVAAWRERDPVSRLTTYLRQADLLDDARIDEIAQEAERNAADLRKRISGQMPPAPDELFAHVYATPTPQLTEQAALLRAELADLAEES